MSDPKTCREWFEEADRHFVEAVQRVMTASTGDAFRSGRECEWAEFRPEMARLQQYAELRHAAKHAAEREAHLSTAPVTIYLDGSAPRQGDPDAKR